MCLLELGIAMVRFEEVPAVPLQLFNISRCNAAIGKMLVVGGSVVPAKRSAMLLFTDESAAAVAR